MSGGPASEVTYERPRTIDEAVSLLERHGPDAKLLAGGQSLMLLLRQGLVDANVLIDVSQIDALRGTNRRKGEYTIGAATTYRELIEDSIATDYRVLEDAIADIGDRQVRNLGTVGGALAHADPSLDLPPALLVLDAQVEIAGTDGKRSVALESFFEGYMSTMLERDELLVAVTVPEPFDGVRVGSAYRKLSSVKGGWATVGVAAAVQLSTDGSVFEGIQLALAAVGETTVRARAVEDSLIGEPTDDESIADAAGMVIEDIDPIDDLSGSATYKQDMATTLVMRTVDGAVEGIMGDA